MRRSRCINFNRTDSGHSTAGKIALFLVVTDPGFVGKAASPDRLCRFFVPLLLKPRVTLDPGLLAAYAASAAANSLRAFRADVVAFDTWCHTRGSRCLPASPELAAGYLNARAQEGAAPASLTRYRASIAKLHRLCRLPDPCQDELVKLTLAAHRRAVGVAQKQARPLRFKGAVKDPLTDSPRGINIRAALEACGETLTELRDKALLSVAYDTGLRTSELVAIICEDIVEALEPSARLLKFERSKGDQEGEGATAYLSPRSVSALNRWLSVAGIETGAVFRRVIVRRYAARAARAKVNSNSLGWYARWDATWFTGKEASPARVQYDVEEAALHPGSVTPIFREILRRAFKSGAFGDLDAKVFEEQLKQISAHSTRVGINQDYFAAGENLAGIMDALSWKSPRKSDAKLGTHAIYSQRLEQPIPHFVLKRQALADNLVQARPSDLETVGEMCKRHALLGCLIVDQTLVLVLLAEPWRWLAEGENRFTRRGRPRPEHGFGCHSAVRHGSSLPSYLVYGMP